MIPRYYAAFRVKFCEHLSRSHKPATEYLQNEIQKIKKKTGMTTICTLSHLQFMSDIRKLVGDPLSQYTSEKYLQVKHATD